MKTIPRRLLKDPVTLEPYEGDGAFGPTYAAAVTVFGKVSYTRQLVRDASGEEVVSEATVYLAPEDAAPVVVGSRATIDARISRVITVSPQARPGEDVLVKVMCS